MIPLAKFTRLGFVYNLMSRRCASEEREVELTSLPAILPADSKDVMQHLPRSFGSSEAGPSQPLLCELFIWHKTLSHPAVTEK